MTKTNSLLLLCITVFLINPVSFTYAQENLSQGPASIGKKGLNNPVVDTGQLRCYDNSRETLYPKPGQPLYGQDAQYEGNAPSYRDNGDGTVTDLVTGLMWSKAVDKKKVSLVEAKKIAKRIPKTPKVRSVACHSASRGKSPLAFISEEIKLIAA